ncbi:MAG TPA: ATP-binding protein [Ktedonobacterales bacterium]|nr:ATP-binding protein [Ktedonobacterales bacterium]
METLTLAAVLVGVSLIAQSQTHVVNVPTPAPRDEVNLLLTVMLLVGPAGCALWLALRLRVPEARWYRALPAEALLGALLAVAPSGILLFLIKQFAARNPARVTEYFTAWLIVSAIFALAFIVYRAGVRLWLWWDGQRRRRLQWSLTHALLMVAVVGAALLGLSVLAGTVLFTRPDTPLLQWITALIFLSVLIIAGMLVILPPIALFSYFFARGASRRVLSLVHATERLRQGDLTARAPVEGVDELAQLQRNFNVMAADLEEGVRELRAERDHVARLLEQRRELVASVSHELRTPVATLRGYLESASMRWDAAPGAADAIPGAIRRDLDVMLHETERLQRLIDDLFTLARAEVGRLDLTLGPVDVGVVARRAVETVAPLAWRAGRVEALARVTPETPIACADAARVEQALHNLLRNAIRHTPPGGIIAVIVEPQGVGEAARVALRVRDTGEGIAAEDLPRVWERFYRSSRARELDGDGGSGLGLALVKEVTEAMGGAVAVESAPGEGSAFSLLLPLAGDGAAIYGPRAVELGATAMDTAPSRQVREVAG